MSAKNRPLQPLDAEGWREIQAEFLPGLRADVSPMEAWDADTECQHGHARAEGCPKGCHLPHGQTDLLDHLAPRPWPGIQNLAVLERGTDQHGVFRLPPAQAVRDELASDMGA